MSQDRPAPPILRLNAGTALAVAALLAQLAERGVQLVPTRCGIGPGKMGRLTADLIVGAGELARVAARRALQTKRANLLHRIRFHSRDWGSRRYVMLICEVLAEVMQGRPGFSAHRLYNLYFARQRATRRRMGHRKSRRTIHGDRVS